jgi:elongation factor G
MDRVGASLDRTIETIRQRLGAKAIAMQLPIGSEANFIGMVDLLTEKAYVWEDQLGVEPREIEIPADLVESVQQKREELIEAIAETDEELTHKYLEGIPLSVEELKKGLRKAILGGVLTPVFCGSSLRNKGVQLLLDAIVDYLPSPLEVPPVKGVKPNTDEEIIRKPSDDEPFSALVFKIVSDPYMGRLAYFRVYSGKINQGKMTYNATKQQNERMGRLLGCMLIAEKILPKCSRVILQRCWGLKIPLREILYAILHTQLCWKALLSLNL